MDKILVLDFGGQYDQLIARRIRNENVYTQIYDHDAITPDMILEQGYKGIVFTGGPNSVYSDSSISCSKKILELGIPILGICYGHQLLAHLEGGKIIAAKERSEYGKTIVHMEDSPLFKDVPKESVCWMSHSDQTQILPEGYRAIAHTDNCAIAAMECQEKNFYGVQFHPEVTHTQYGTKILFNFIFEICKCDPDWRIEDFAQRQIERYKQELGSDHVLLGLSGGVDSVVCGILLSKAIGKNLHCVLVDHGLFRMNEVQEIEKTMRKDFDIDLTIVNAKDRFLSHLQGVKEPEAKRKIIGEDFIRVFEEEAKRLKDIRILAQGTIYPDVIESGKGSSATIKSHHNVGGLPDRMRFEKIIEPLNTLFKDEVRKLGLQLGIDRKLVYRQPFPGPGLSIRVIGEVNEEKLEMLKKADAIFREELEKANLSPMSDQYFAILTDTKSVGVKGDARTYGFTVALRAVRTDDFMTAEWSRLPYEVLEKVSGRITNEVEGVGRVVYDITSKPPATVEWE